MTAKGLVFRDEANRAHVYRATFTQDAMQSRLLRDLSNRLFAGSAAQLALHALSMETASEDELAEIRAILDRKPSVASSHTQVHKSSRKDRP
jgi:predicted transcriptional regulator